MRVGTWSVGFDQMAICMSLKEGLDYQWIPFSSGLNLFLSGAIDATLAMSYNEANQLLEAGFTVSDSNTYRFCEHGYNVQEDGVYMTRQYYESHKEQARKFAEASRRGWEWAVEHPDETLEIVMDYVTRNHIATNRVMQKLMLEEVLRLLVDRESGQREYRLRPDMVKLANSLMLENQLLLRGVPYEELIAR
jgi:NitT/TauT family transport system substrate-binding protein